MIIDSSRIAKTIESRDQTPLAAHTIRNSSTLFVKIAHAFPWLEVVYTELKSARDYNVLVLMKVCARERAAAEAESDHLIICHIMPSCAMRVVPFGCHFVTLCARQWRCSFSVLWCAVVRRLAVRWCCRITYIASVVIWIREWGGGSERQWDSETESDDARTRSLCGDVLCGRRLCAAAPFVGRTESSTSEQAAARYAAHLFQENNFAACALCARQNNDENIVWLHSGRPQRCAVA